MDPNLGLGDLAGLTSASERRASINGAYGNGLQEQSFSGSLGGVDETSLAGFSNGYPSHSHHSDYQFSDRSSLPPSLWMSPTSTTPSSPNFSDHTYTSPSQLSIPPHLLPEAVAASSSSSSTHPDSGRSTAPTSASSPQSSRNFSDLFNDNLFPSRKPSVNDSVTSNFPSPKITGSPDLKAAELAAEDVDPERLAREDPLATQVWKMYAKTKATLPHGQRMENLTWRMMALALRKKKEDEEKSRLEEKSVKQEVSADNSADILSSGRPPGGESGASTEERGRTKGKARVKVVGFDGMNQDGVEETECECVLLFVANSNCQLRMSSYSEEPMDWRAMSRSRSRVPMDWRPSSRSRSRPPMSGLLSDQSQFRFPSVSPPKHPSSPTKPVPTNGRRSPQLPPMALAAVYESNAEHNTLHDLPPFSTLTSPINHPSSLPALGLHGFPRASMSTAPSPEQRTFPKHVRKTSFDHTVAREGFFTGVSGRHQVNGRPLPPEKLVGTKRRAEAPHVESMLRGDSGLDNAMADAQDIDSGIPSTPFNFSFQPYDNFLDMPHPGSELHHLAHHHQKARMSGTFDPLHIGGTYSPLEQHNEGLSAAAAAASVAVAEGYAQLNVANLAGLDDPGLDYSLMGMGMGMGLYSNLDSHQSLGHHPYTHVDPTQILPLDHGDGPFQSFHPSPSSDGWGNGVNSSSTASPEPYITSNASTPPSVEGLPNGSARNVRKIASSKRVENASKSTQRKGYVCRLAAMGF